MLLSVVKSTQSSKDSSRFVTKLVGKTDVQVIDGLPVPASQCTYYVILNQQLPVNHQVNINLDNWNVSIKPFEVVDEETGEISVLQLKYLYPKM